MVWWISLVAAAPRFVGTVDDVSIATRAWAAAEGCAGRTPPIEEVVVVRDLAKDEYKGFAGLARSAPPKHTVRLRESATPVVLAHEIAHAWINGLGVTDGRGVGLLVEGRTQVLTECIQRREPELFRTFLEETTALESLPDLRTWRPLDAQDESTRHHGYHGSFRYFRAVAALLPPEHVYGPELDTWTELELALGGSGPVGVALRDALAGGPSAVRALLADADLDGQSLVMEQIRGWDPALYDSDGDGWWDGAPAHPADAQPLPKGGQTVCLARIPEGATRVNVRYGGQLAGMDLTDRVSDNIAAGSVVDWEWEWRHFAGGLWIRADAEVTVENSQCAVRPGVTVRSSDPAPPGALAALADAAVYARADLAKLGAEHLPPVQVSVYGEALYLRAVASSRGGELLLPKAFVPLIVKNAGSYGRQVAALGAVRRLPEPEQDAAAGALVVSVFPRTPTAILDAPAYARAPWIAAAKACSRGWPGVLEGECKP